jgi:hypothetical protein
MANVANFVKESCSTFGTGNLILTGAISGFTTFASALPAGSVYYTIVDGTNREAGIGTYDGAATIVRSNVIATLASGVYDDISPTPLVLTGAAVVGCGIEATLAAKIEHSNRAILDAIDVAYTSALDTKLSGIEDAADVTDATNVAAAGAVMYTDTNVSTAGWVVDEDTLVSADDTRVPTQQSVKNYVDSAVTSSVTASNVSVDTTGFAGILSGTDDDVQTALDTLDDHTHEGSTIDASGATDGHVLTADGAGNAAWEPIPGITGTAWGDITGTLSAQTDLQSALGGKEPADPTILKEADIGVTVQAYDADIPTVAASQAEMEAGTEMALRSMSPLRVKQAIDAIAAGNPADPTILKEADIGVTVQAYNANIPTVAASQAEMEAGTEAGLRSMSPLMVKQAIAALGGGGGGGGAGLFYKEDSRAVAFTLTGGVVKIKAGTKIDVKGKQVEYAVDTTVTLPALTAGTDYAIWVKDDGTIQASNNFSSAPGAGNWRKIGGFHYAPGGNAAAQLGGDTTPAINKYSLWDLKFRPACSDPRGMTLVSGAFWSDIYLLGVDHLTNGTSKYNVTIASGSRPPKKPTAFGGNGTNAYSSMNWWEANEVLQSYGKRSPTYSEFAALAYGTTEETSSGGTDVPNTGVNGTGATSGWNAFTSKWGVMQAAGCMWTWGADFGGPYAAASWSANTQSRGSTYNLANASLFGGCWHSASASGSRCSLWYYSPSDSYGNFGVRGVCDHLELD